MSLPTSTINISDNKTCGTLEINTKLNIWSEKYLVVQDSILRIYSDEKSMKEEFGIPINEQTCINIISPSGDQFSIKNPKQKTVSFRCQTPQIATNWILALRSQKFLNPSLKIEDFQIISKIGQGYYGRVRLAKKRDTGEFYAIKSIHKRQLLDSNSVQSVFNERNILSSCNFPFIVSLYYTFQSPTKFYFCLEFVPGGDLFRHMNKTGPLSLNEARFYIAEISLALDFLHNIAVVYRDLTPENILLDAQGHIKLAGFGLSKDICKDKFASTFCGTNEYLAPEIIQNQDYSFEVDWWALGILFYEMLIGVTPFFNMNRNLMFKNIIESDIQIPSYLDPLPASLIVGLLIKDPAKRFGIQEIKKHPLFDGMDWKQIENKQLKPIFVPDCKDPMDLSNFDKNFTEEPAFDSVATPMSGSLGTFSGFSYAQNSLTPNDENSVIPDFNSMENDS